MVSLSRNFSTSTGGGVFFNDASLNSADEDTQQLQPVRGSDELKQFMPLHTIVIVLFQLSLVTGILILAILLICLWPEDRENCEPYFILQYIHAVFWCISFITHHLLKAKHHMLRVYGYLEFYQQTYNQFRIPFYVVSVWNTIMLVVGTLFHQLYQHFEDQCKSNGFPTPAMYLCGIIALEVFVLIPLIGTYVRRVSQFNRNKPLPDAQREEWMSNFIQDSYSGGEVGYRERGDMIHDLLERQADLIRYLKERNAQLSCRIGLLHSQARGDRS